jgi:hypothetical protein
MKRVIFILLSVAVLICTLGCGNEPPIVTFPIYHVVVYESGTFNVPQNSVFLSIYFNLHDDNGEEDLSSIRITHVETEYSWSLPYNSLSKTIWQDRSYSGYALFEYNEGKSILTGDYFIEVEDKAGNITDTVINVSLDPDALEETGNTEIEVEAPEVPYAVEVTNKNRELKITGNQYESCEIKFLDNPSLYNNGRKKFKSGDKIILNNNKPAEAGNRISVRINSDVNETVVYFMKPVVVRAEE